MLPDIKNKTYSLAEVLMGGWRVYFRSLSVLLPIILIVYIPINIALAFLPKDFLVRLGSMRGLRMELVFIQGVEFFFGIIATMATINVVQASVSGRPLSAGAALKSGLSRWGAAIITQIIACLIIGIALLFLVIPGVIFGIYYVFAVYVVALKGVGGMRALDYSKHLVRGQWLRTFGIISVIYGLGTLTGWGMRRLAWLMPEAKIAGALFATGINLVMTLFVVMAGVFFINTDYQRSLARAAE